MDTILGGIARFFSSPSVRTPLPKLSSAARVEAVPESPEPEPEPQPEPERKRKRKRKHSANQDEDLIPTQVEVSPLPDRELELGSERKQERKRKRKHSSHQDAGSPVAPAEAPPDLAEPPEHEHEHEPEPERKRKRKRKHSVHQDQTNGSTKRKKTYKSDAVIRHTDDDSAYDVPDSPVAAAIDVTQDPSKTTSPSDTHDGTNKKSSPAERELARIWTIRRPPDVRSDGYFSNDEREIARRALVAFREDNGLSTLELVTLIQEIMPQGKRSQTTVEKTPVKFSGADSQKLWRFVYGEFHNYDHDQKRSKTSIKKYIRRHYTVFKGFGQWTDDEDHLLESLYEQYGAQWQLISSLMGNRSSDAIRARYTNFLECGDKRNTDEWSEEEEERLRKAISAFMRKDTKKRVKDGNPPLSEYDSRDIDWSVVSQKLDHSRSRKQCQWKWVSLCRQEHEERAK